MTEEPVAWKVTIDQIAESGGRALYEHESDESLLANAIEDALAHACLLIAEVGQYQITATRRTT